VKGIGIAPKTERGSGQSISFVLTIGSARQACVLKTTFKTQLFAAAPDDVRSGARARFQRGEIEDGVVKLSML
jgi:hypothetical protein